MLTKSLISVIIPHLNQPEGLEACLCSLEAQTLDASLFEVIVVDNGSSFLPDAVIKRHPNARLFQELKPGPGRARNRGVEVSNANIFCFIDSDCRAHPRWLDAVARAFHSSPAGTVLGGDVQIWGDSTTNITGVEAYERIFAYRQKMYIEEHGFSGTGNLAVRRADFVKVGPFGGIEIAEDIDWGRRAHAVGLKFWFVPEMIVFHAARSSVRDLMVKWDRHLQHAVNMGQNRGLRKFRWAVRALLILLSPIADGIRIMRSNQIHGASARWRATGVLIAVRTYRAWRMVVLLGPRQDVVWNRTE